MSALEALAPLGASLSRARLHLRMARMALAEPLPLRPDGIDAALVALDDRLSSIHFALESAFHAAHDRIAMAGDRFREIAQLPGSTLLTYAAVGLMAFILADDLIRGPATVPAPQVVPQPQPEWFEITRPHGAFALNSSSLESVEARYIVRRHRFGGGRKDDLTFGDPAARGPYVRAVLYRPGSEGIAEPDPLEAVVEVAAAAAIHADLQDTDRKLATKFGALPVIAMNVSTAIGSRHCVATAAAWNDPRLGLTAWWCNDGPELVSYGEFACLLDRIALMSAGGDDRLAEFFAHAELKRRTCGPQGSFVSPTPARHDDWIQAKAKPALRGRLSTR